MEQRHPRQIRPMYRWVGEDLVDTAEQAILLIKKFGAMWSPRWSN